MRKSMWVVLIAAGVALAAQTDTDRRGGSVVTAAAEALGGKIRILSLKSLAVEG